MITRRHAGKSRNKQCQCTVNILNNPSFLNESDFTHPHLIEVATQLTLKPDNTSSEPASSRAGELWTLIENLLGTVIGSLGASAGIVRVVSPDSQMLQIAGAFGLPAEVCEDESVVDIACGVCGRAACDKKIHTADAAVCAQGSSRDFFGEACKYVVAAPLEYRGKLIGIFTLYFAASENVPDNISQSLRPYAELVGIALESGRKNIENQRMQLLAERQAMANEIHDSLAHTLYYARMRMSLLLDAVRTQNEQMAIKCARDVDEALGSGQKTIREIITHFRCQMNPLGLQHALQALVDEFRERTDITMTYTNRVANLKLPLESELQIFHIVREALVNVETHSAATHARLSVEFNNGDYVFTISDNGAGCGNAPTEGHYGLMIMRERALRIGGEIWIDSSEGSGTQVQLKLPEPK